MIGVAIIAACAALGALASIVLGRPGAALGLLILGGTVAAGLVVSPRAAYKIIPAPALAYVAAAVLAGLVRDHALATSKTAISLIAVQWIAGGYRWMIVATTLAILLTVARWWSDRRITTDHSRRGRGSPEGRTRTARSPDAGVRTRVPPEKDPYGTHPSAGGQVTRVLGDPIRNPPDEYR
jgi:hypothetical protein